MKLAILGGTFNPVHNAHLFVAQETAHILKLDKVLLIPDNLPPHKNYKPEVTPEQRLKMLKAAVKDNALFSVLDIELKRGGVSYTIDTVRQIYKIYKNCHKIFFIIGSDLLPELDEWKNINELKKLVDFVVYERKGTDVFSHLEKYPYVKPVQGETLNISSTQIRQRLKKGKSIKYLVPAQVENYIKKKALYST